VGPHSLPGCFKEEENLLHLLGGWVGSEPNKNCGKSYFIKIRSVIVELSLDRHGRPNVFT
jgi:hypothetical protein